MTKLRLLVAAGVLLALGVAGSAAIAAPPGTYTCSGGTEASPTIIPAGTYDGLNVTGICAFAPAGAVTINGDVRVEPGAILNDHAGSPATSTHITGNVQVGEGAVLGLGTYAPGATHDVATVDGNIVAHAPASLYVTRTTVHGNVVSNGGGDPVRNFPLKDDTIDGNVVITGWSGLWLGVIRDIVGGNVIVSNTAGTQTGEPPFEGVPDSTEVATNQIGGNLICHGNTPPAQIGDAVLEGGSKNDVGGNKLGECADL
jgi:hypothetical protein